jgi:hypothetical protein
MEHPIQFSIEFDDAILKKRIVDNAERQVLKTITDEVKAELFGCDYYGRPRSNYVAEWVHEKVKAFLEENKGEIIDQASKELADRLLRSKNVREAAGEIAKRVDA